MGMMQPGAIPGVPICFSEPLLTWDYFIHLNRRTKEKEKKPQTRWTKGTSKLQIASNTVGGLFLKETNGEDRENRSRGKREKEALVPVEEEGQRHW